MNKHTKRNKHFHTKHDKINTHTHAHACTHARTHAHTHMTAHTCTHNIHEWVYNVHQVHFFTGLVPSVLPMLKTTTAFEILLGNAGIISYSVIHQHHTKKKEKKKRKKKKKNIYNTIHFVALLMHNSKYTNTNTWQQAAHTTYQLSSPRFSTRAIQKSLMNNAENVSGENRQDLGVWTTAGTSRKNDKKEQQKDYVEEPERK